jgi:hypothetical protein
MWRVTFVTGVVGLLLAGSIVFADVGFVFAASAFGLGVYPSRWAYVFWGGSLLCALAGWSLSLPGSWLAFAVFLMSLGGAWMLSSLLVRLPAWLRASVMIVLMSVVLIWLVAPFLGLERVCFDVPLSPLRNLQRNQVVLGWLVLAAFGLEGFWAVLSVFVVLGFVCAGLPFYGGIAALFVGGGIWCVGQRWPLWGLLSAGAFWTFGVFGVPLWVRGMGHLMPLVTPFVGGALERRVVHWQELLLKVDLNPLWGVGWGQAPLLSQNCLLQPFAFPHHSLLQLWLEGGLVWVILVWAAGGVALVALWPVRARGAPFWGWLGGLIVLGYQGSLWDFGWLYGVSVTGVSVFRIGLAENRQGTKISS